jgi:hypothetical protein
MNVPPECEHTSPNGLIKCSRQANWVVIDKTTGKISYRCEVEHLDLDLSHTYSIFPAKDYSKPEKGIYYWGKRTIIRESGSFQPLPPRPHLKMVTCPTCLGRGHAKGHPCFNCDRTGEVHEVHIPDGQSATMIILDETGDKDAIQESRRRMLKEDKKKVCPRCKGKGTLPDPAIEHACFDPEDARMEARFGTPRKKCSRCAGTGKI